MRPGGSEVREVVQVHAYTHDELKRFRGLRSVVDGSPSTLIAVRLRSGFLR